MLLENHNTNSSVIKNWFYNAVDKKLKITFQSGQVYEYEGVDANVYQSLCEAESHGKYFSQNIKNNYSFTKLLLD
tara:strand:+ start:8166 stop:8390 length:225 start_codon:yes stop_codon:yes gene_type:complete